MDLTNIIRARLRLLRLPNRFHVRLAGLVTFESQPPEDDSHLKAEEDETFGEESTAEFAFESSCLVFPSRRAGGQG